MGIRRAAMGLVAAAVTLGVAAGPAAACGGLIGRNGSVNLVKTTTLAAYHDGLEHYVTAFKFAGGEGEFGSIVPLPGVPSNIERGGDWTLQRLVREVAPPVEFAAADVRAAASVPASAEVLQQVKVDALDLTVLKGGGQSVAQWAADNGFRLPPDGPEVLDFYAERSPIFLAAKFDADAARAKGVAIGDGTPVHLTIPTSNPWVPLRILAVGRDPLERIDADVFLLNDRRPVLLSGDTTGRSVQLARDEAAPTTLLTDLRSDKGMSWVPDSMWLSYVKIAAAPADLTYDLAVDASGKGQPSRTAAGLGAATTVMSASDAGSGISAGAVVAIGAFVAGILALAAFTVAGSMRRSRNHDAEPPAHHSSTSASNSGKPPMTASGLPSGAPGGRDAG